MGLKIFKDGTNGTNYGTLFWGLADENIYLFAKDLSLLRKPE